MKATTDDGSAGVESTGTPNARDDSESNARDGSEPLREHEADAHRCWNSGDELAYRPCYRGSLEFPNPSVYGEASA